MQAEEVHPHSGDVEEVKKVTSFNAREKAIASFNKILEDKIDIVYNFFFLQLCFFKDRIFCVNWW
jgi:hypothetical protein